MNYGQDRMKCPACGGIAESDSVDVGVGLIVRGNFSCSCGWEIDGPDDWGFLDPDERPFAPPDAV
jgi:hypothetical protein